MQPVNFSGIICSHNKNHPYYRFTKLPETIQSVLFDLILNARGCGIPAIQSKIKLDKLMLMSNEEISDLFNEELLRQNDRKSDN